MKRMLLFFLLMLPALIFAQNILKNGALEDPTKFALNASEHSGGYYFKDWLSIGESHPDYVYDADEISIEPADGLGVLGFNFSTGIKENAAHHVIGSFSKEMVPDMNHTIEFQIALDRNSSHAGNSFIVYFTKERNHTLEDVESYYVIDDGAPITNMRWRTVRFEYPSKGGELYIHIQTEAHVPFRELSTLGIESFESSQEKRYDSRYYIDAISITPNGRTFIAPPKDKAVALLFDMRKSHETVQHDLSKLQSRLSNLGKVQEVSIITLGAIPELHYRGSWEELRFTELKSLIARTTFQGNGSISGGIQEGINSVQEFDLQSHVIVFSEFENSVAQDEDERATVLLWRQDDQEEERVILKQAINAPFVPFTEAMQVEKGNQYSFAIGADDPNPKTLKYLRAELSMLIAAIRPSDKVSLSSSLFGNIQMKAVSPSLYTPLFFSEEIVMEKLAYPAVRPMTEIMEEINEYKGSYRTDYHPDSMRQVVIGVTDHLINFKMDKYEYPISSNYLLSEIKSTKDVPLFVAVLNPTDGNFKYYEFEQETESWKECERTKIFPLNKEEDYHSFRYQQYINDNVSP